MSPQHQVLQRHGSPQPGMMNTPGMRPPMMADGRFIRPTGAPGKEMRPRMPVSQVPRGHQPNFGPRPPMHMRVTLRLFIVVPWAAVQLTSLNMAGLVLNMVECRGLRRPSNSKCNSLNK